MSPGARLVRTVSGTLESEQPIQRIFDKGSHECNSNVEIYWDMNQTLGVCFGALLGKKSVVYGLLATSLAQAWLRSKRSLGTSRGVPEVICERMGRIPRTGRIDRREARIRSAGMVGDGGAGLSDLEGVRSSVLLLIRAGSRNRASSASRMELPYTARNRSLYRAFIRIASGLPVQEQLTHYTHRGYAVSIAIGWLDLADARLYIEVTTNHSPYRSNEVRRHGRELRCHRRGTPEHIDARKKNASHRTVARHQSPKALTARLLCSEGGHPVSQRTKLILDTDAAHRGPRPLAAQNH